MRFELKQRRTNLVYLSIFGCFAVFFLLTILTSSSTNKVISRFSAFSLEMFTKNVGQQSLRRPRIAAILSVSSNKSYLFVVAFAVAAWKKISVESIVFVVGRQEEVLKHHYAKVAFELIVELGAQIHFIQNKTMAAPTLSQTSRLFAAAMPFSKDFADDDIFITTDADLLPFHLKNHIPNLFAAQKAYLYNADCIGPTAIPPARGNHKVPMYPMSTIAATVSSWREIMGFNSTNFNENNIEAYLRTEFGQKFFHPNDGEKKDLVSSGTVWYVDQILISYKFDEWFKVNPDNRAATTLTRGKCYPRIDRIEWPSPDNLRQLDLNLLGDAHLLTDAFTNDKWKTFRPLIEQLFKGDKFALLRKRFDQYRADFVE